MTTVTLRVDAPHLPGNLHSDTPWANTLRARRQGARAKALAANPNWRPMLIGEDLDGVNYLFGYNYRAYLVSHCGYPAEILSAEDQHWYFYRDLGQSDADFVATCHEAVDAGILFRTGAPYEGAPESWQALIEAGHEIHVVTDRRFGTGDASLAATVAWLDEYRFPYDSITISPDKTIIPELDTFGEDRLENYDDLAAADMAPVLVNRNWNHIPGGDHRRRVASQPAFANLILTGQITAR